VNDPFTVVARTTRFLVTGRASFAPVFGTGGLGTGAVLTVRGSWRRPVVDMLLDAWAATMGRPAYTNSTVPDILGASRTFRQWASDHAAAFTGAQAAGQS